VQEIDDDGLPRSYKMEEIFWGGSATPLKKLREVFTPEKGGIRAILLVSAPHFGYSPCAQAHQDKDLIQKKHLLNPLFRFCI
jgi:hypothetical protein